MNGAIKKFRKYVIKRLEILDNELSNEIKEYIAQNTSELNKEVLSSAIQNQSNQLYIRMCNWRKKKLTDNYLKMRSNEVSVLDSLKMLLSLFDNPGSYKIENYDLIDFILNKYNFTDVEKGQVYAFFVNSNYYFYKNFRCEGNEDYVREYTLEQINDSLDEKMSKRKLNALLDEKVKDFDKNQEETFKKYLDIRFLISTDGDLIPNIDANQFEYLFEMEELSEEQITMMLNASKSLAQEELDKKHKREAKENNLKEAKRQVAINAQKPLVIYKDDNKQYKDAFQKLKKYLKDDLPITFITDEELEEVLSLLRIVGYHDSLIAEIKRNILLNNQKLCQEEQENKFVTAKERYLSQSDKDILVNAEVMLNQEDAIKNNVYEELHVMFNSVKEQLIRFLDVEDENDEKLNDDVMYLLLCIEELGSLMASYKSSNYKLFISPNSN